MAIAQAQRPAVLRLLSILLCLGLALLAGCRAGSGVTKYNSPSASANAALLMGIRLQRVEVADYHAREELQSVKLEEAWLEEIVERYDSWPIRKGRTGTRLCVRFSDPEDKLVKEIIAALEAGVEPDSWERGWCKLYRENRVYSLETSGEFPKEGRIVLHHWREDDELISFTFRVP